MWYIIIGVFTIFALLLWYLKKRNEYWKDRNVPFEPSTLLVGNMAENIMGKKSLADVFEDFYKKYKDYKYVGLMNYGTPILLIRDVDLVKNILIKDFSKYANNAFKIDENKDPVLSKNPFFATEKRWKQIRDQLTPQFTPMKIKAMFPLMVEVKHGLVKYLNKEPEAIGKNGLNAKDISLKFTTDMVASCAFGLNGNSFVDPESDFLRVIKAVFNIDSYVVVIIQLLLLLFPGLYAIYTPTILQKSLSDKFKNIILATIAEREEKNIKRGDFLDAVVEMRQKATDFDYTSDYMTAHAMSFLLDGVETSALVLQYVLYELAANKDVQEKLRLQFEDMLERNDGNLTHDSLFEVKYLDMVIKETLRKYPPIPLLLKETTETTVLPSPVSGSPEIVIQKGTGICIPSGAIQNDPDYFKNPEKFNPERFDDDSEERPNHAFMPFGDGPRVCIGRRFAVAQIKVAVFTIVTNFEMSVNDKTPKKFVRPPTDFFNNVAGGIWLNFFPRK